MEIIRVLCVFTARAYGHRSRPAVLCVHGIQDNCDSFATLLPLLPVDRYYVCVDLPGHGRSSHFPAHVPLEFVNYVAAIKWTVDHFGWPHLAYVGHSFGGQLGTWFAGLYPERVRCLIVLDTMGPRSVDMDHTVAAVRSRIDDAQSLHRRQCGRGPPVYTFGQAVAKMKAGRPSTLTDESAAILAVRGLTRVRRVRPEEDRDGAGGDDDDDDDDQYAFASDQRLKLDFHPLMSFDQQKQILSNMACPALFVLADENLGRYSTYLKDAYGFYTQRPHVTIRVISGDHTVHLNYPDRVSGHVSDFLRENYKN